MSMKTQEDVWRNLFNLLLTTNLIADRDERKRIAMSGQLVMLQQTCIQVDRKGGKQWSTYRMSLADLIGLMIEEVEVGKKGTKLKQCLTAMQIATIHAGVKYPVVELHRTQSQAEIVMRGILPHQSQIATSIQADWTTTESGATFSLPDSDTILMLWTIPLRKHLPIPD